MSKFDELLASHLQSVSCCQLIAEDLKNLKDTQSAYHNLLKEPPGNKEYMEYIESLLFPHLDTETNKNKRAEMWEMFLLELALDQKYADILHAIKVDEILSNQLIQEHLENAKLLDEKTLFRSMLENQLMQQQVLLKYLSSINMRLDVLITSLRAQIGVLDRQIQVLDREIRALQQNVQDNRRQLGTDLVSLYGDLAQRSTAAPTVDIGGNTFTISDNAIAQRMMNEARQNRENPAYRFEDIADNERRVIREIINTNTTPEERSAAGEARLAQIAADRQVALELARSMYVGEANRGVMAQSGEIRSINDKILVKSSEMQEKTMKKDFCVHLRDAAEKHKIAVNIESNTNEISGDRVRALDQQTIALEHKVTNPIYLAPIEQQSEVIKASPVNSDTSEVAQAHVQKISASDDRIALQTSTLPGGPSIEVGSVSKRKIVDREIADDDALDTRPSAPDYTTIVESQGRSNVIRNPNYASSRFFANQAPQSEQPSRDEKQDERNNIQPRSGR